MGNRKLVQLNVHLEKFCYICKIKLVARCQLPLTLSIVALTAN